MALIVIVDDGERKHRVKISRKPFIIGRSSRCHLKILDDLISGQHLSISLDGRRTIVKDLNSTNGTFLNGAKISECFLMIGDHITVGKVILKLDTSSMDKDEKKIHTRPGAGKTQLQFVNFPASGTQTSAKVDIPPSTYDDTEGLGEDSIDIGERSILVDLDRPDGCAPPPPEQEEPKEEKDSQDSDFQELHEFKASPPDDDQESEGPQTQFTTVSQKDIKNEPPQKSDRYKKLVDKMKKKGAPEELKRSDEVEFAQEVSSGNTQFIKMSKDIKSKKAKSRKTSTAKGSKKSPKKVKQESLIGKLISIIKELF